MAPLLLDGRTTAQQLSTDLSLQLERFQAQHQVTPQLAVVQVPGDQASSRYVRSIERLCKNLRLGFHLALLPADCEQNELEATITALNHDPAIDGILLQLPLPAHLSADAAILQIDYRKDVDGVHPINAGLLAQGRSALVPNTPAGGMELLHRYAIDPAGKRAVVVGRSTIVGRPMAALLVQAHATVTIAHSRTTDLAAVIRQAEIVAVAVGKAGLIDGSMIQPKAVVLDFGTNVLSDGSLVGDVDFASVAPLVRAISPVPGGTGPMTNMMLASNLLRAAQQRREMP